MKSESSLVMTNLAQQIQSFELKVEVVMKKFKRLTCDWLKMQERLDKTCDHMCQYGN